MKTNGPRNSRKPNGSAPVTFWSHRRRSQDIADKWAKGEKFEALAKQFSLDGSKDYGGDLGYFSAPEMVPAFSEAAFALKTGEMSRPVKTDFGWHIIV